MICPACFAEVVHLAEPLAIVQPVDDTPEAVLVCRECFSRYINIVREATMRAVARVRTPVPEGPHKSPSGASPLAGDARLVSPAIPPPTARPSTARRRGANGRFASGVQPGGARALGLDPLPMPDASAGGEDPRQPPVPEFAAGEEQAGTVITQADVEAIERTLRGEVPKDTYVPEDATPKPWIAG